MQHSRPETMSAVCSSAGMCRPKWATVVMSLPFLMIAVTNADPEQLADPFDVDRSHAGDLTGLARHRVAAHERVVVDDHMGRVPARLPLRRIAGDGFRERVRRVGVL